MKLNLFTVFESFIAGIFSLYQNMEGVFPELLSGAVICYLWCDLLR